MNKVKMNKGRTHRNKMRAGKTRKTRKGGQLLSAVRNAATRLAASTPVATAAVQSHLNDAHKYASAVHTKVSGLAANLKPKLESAAHDASAVKDHIGKAVALAAAPAAAPTSGGKKSRRKRRHKKMRKSKRH
jgi:hydroxypyruvate isomerase